MARTDAPVLVWFRDDLRLADNPALTAALASARPLIALYCFDEASPGLRPLGGASRWWLHGSLERLAADLAARGVPLILRRGAAADIIRSIVAETGIAAVYWNRRYGAAERLVDSDIKTALTDGGVACRSFQASLLFEPWTIATQSGQPFRVFSPFWRACRATPEPRLPLPVPPAWSRAADAPPSDALADWRLLPRRPDWAGGLRAAWQPGEAAAQARLQDFIDEDLARYAAERDRPDIAATSRLSAPLRFGEISPFSLWHAARYAAESGAVAGQAAEKFLSEIGWREFSWHLFFHNPHLATKNIQPRFDAFPWPPCDEAALVAWQRGETGIPIVDAGMRELWVTGWMHNRVRMIVASFLTKNLLIDWRRGEEWFWDTLVDADAANNAASWQWVAGSGADAAPYFRIFNPVKQGETFDPDGDYIRTHVPSLARVRVPAIHQAGAGGARGYPQPIVDLAASRARALEAFAHMRSEP